MSRDYGKVSTSVWRSKRFKSLPVTYCPRLFYLYLHSCTHVNSSGCFWLPKGYIGADLKWSDSDIDRAIQTNIDTGLIAYDDAEEVVYIEKFLDHSPITNAKHALGALKQAEMLPSCSLKYRIIKELLSSRWCAGLGGLEKYTALADRCLDTPINTTETETETERERKKEGGANAQSEYGFAGLVVKLKHDDLAKWRKAYSAVPDIIAEIMAADAYYAENPPRDGKWFFPVSNWLKKAHADALAKRSSDSDDGIYAAVQ